LRYLQTNKYCNNENLLKVRLGRKTYNIATSIIQIIDEYAKVKTDSFKRFIDQCKQIENQDRENGESVSSFILDLLAPNVDARLFEIVSYAILKNFYKHETIFWGFTRKKLNEENLILYKTGRTNANDGGIDFVMKPLGNFYQVTETLDVKKYFLDIDKLEHYPVKFVIKTNESVEEILNHLRENAIQQYGIEIIVNRYMNSIDEVINIPMLILYLSEAD
jgi:hypothetical protein